MKCSPAVLACRPSRRARDAVSELEMPSQSKIRPSSSSPAEAGPVVEPSKIRSSSSSPPEAAPKSRQRKLVVVLAMPWPHVLTLAGSDSDAGAGIQADIKACAALGAYCSSVITAITAQNTVGIQGVHAVPEEFIEQQLNSVLSDLSVDVGGSEPPQSSCQKFEDVDANGDERGIPSRELKNGTLAVNGDSQSCAIPKIKMMMTIDPEQG